MQQETAFKNKLLPKLKAIPNSWVLKTQEMSKSGVPDILMCLNGMFIALELKTDTGKVSKLQGYNLDKIKKCNGIALVVTPSNYIEVLDKLIEVGRG